MRDILVTIIGALLIFNALKIIIPDGKMKKYLTFIISIFMMVIIITPIAGLAGIAPPSLNVDYSKEAPAADELSQVQVKQILAEYERQLITDFHKTVPALFDGLSDIQIGFVEDASQQDFGTVDSIKIISNRERDEDVVNKLSSLYSINKEVISWERK